MTFSQDNRFKAIQCILAIHSREDLVTQEPITDESTIEHHHIFPRSYSKKPEYGWGSKVDSVANLIATTKESNRKIGDKAPSEYLGDLNTQARKNGTEADLRRRLDQALFPFTEDVGTPNWNKRIDVNAYQSFLTARAQIIHKKIGELIGQSLVDKEPTDGDDDDA